MFEVKWYVNISQGLGYRVFIINHLNAIGFGHTRLRYCRFDRDQNGCFILVFTRTTGGFTIKVN